MSSWCVMIALSSASCVPSIGVTLTMILIPNINTNMIKLKLDWTGLYTVLALEVGQFRRCGYRIMWEDCLTCHTKTTCYQPWVSLLSASEVNPTNPQNAIRKLWQEHSHEFQRWIVGGIQKEKCAPLTLSRIKIFFHNKYFATAVNHRQSKGGMPSSVINHWPTCNTSHSMEQTPNDGTWSLLFYQLTNPAWDFLIQGMRETSYPYKLNKDADITTPVGK